GGGPGQDRRSVGNGDFMPHAPTSHSLRLPIHTAVDTSVPCTRVVDSREGRSAALAAPEARHALHAHERGIAFVLGFFFAIIVAGLVATGTLVLSSTRTRTEVNFRLHGQAAQFARAGLTEALGWFRRQTTQPVTVFAPVLDTTVT